MGDPWSHNIHYHRTILDAVPGGATRALDVGCGEGMLTRALARHVPAVVGIDVDQPSLASAQRAGASDTVEYIHGDFLSHPFEDESFDFVAAVAVVHHLDFEAALKRMQSVLRQGGTLAVLGLAKSHSPGDIAVDAAGAVATRFYRLRKQRSASIAPVVWPPPMRYAEVRRHASRLLPGVVYRRHLLFRYSLVWVKPAG